VEAFGGHRELTRSPRSLREDAPRGPHLEAPTGQTLERLCGMARWLFDAQSGALVLHQRDVGRVIASSGLSRQFRSREWSFDLVGYDPGDRVVLTDASAAKDIQPKLRLLGLDQAGFYLRAPVIVETNYVLSLIVADATPRKAPDARKMKLLDDLIGLIRVEFTALETVLRDPDAHVTAAIHLDEVRRSIGDMKDPAALLDAQLRLIAINDALAARLGRPPADLLGLRPKDLGEQIMADSIDALCRRALDARLSPPDFEIVTKDHSGVRRVLQVAISPFSPIETTDYFLFISAREISGFLAREESLSRRIGKAEGRRAPEEPSLTFLLETLIERRSIRARNGVHYLTLRSWRAAIRDWQIKALRALKGKIPPAMPQAIARDICAETEALLGVSAFRAVVPVPCGHSAETACLSLEIARAVGAGIGAPVVQAFAFQNLKGSSHPKENTRRPKLKLINPVNEPVLIVDDVSTSGAHLEEAVKLLRPHAGLAFAVAWIGGDAV